MTRDTLERLEVPHTGTYAEIKEHLSSIIVCYGEREGCSVDDDLNHSICTEGECLLLKVYRAGYRAAKEEKE